MGKNPLRGSSAVSKRLKESLLEIEDRESLVKDLQRIDKRRKHIQAKINEIDLKAQTARRKHM